MTESDPENDVSSPDDDQLGDGIWETEAESDDDLASAAAAAAELEEDFDGDRSDPSQEGLLPIVAVVGRPNVGKSTLVNRILGRRAAVVEDVPGVTRDRVSYPAEWAGREFMLLDTGGWDPRKDERSAAVTAQAEQGMADADVVMFIVDATVGPTAADEAVVRLLRRSSKPVVLVANKVDDAAAEAEASSLWSLGLGEPVSVSALHGRGSGDLLDRIIALLPEQGQQRVRSDLHRVALVGKPNVGKSSLLNKLAGEQRSVVHDQPGTTVDPIDEVVEIDGQEWLFIDTAGIRRKAKTASGHEYFASIRSRIAIDRAQVAVVVIEASQSVSEQDIRLIQMVIDAGRALVIAFNKWDLIDDERRHYLEREIERDLAFVDWAPRVNVSALTGRRLDRLTNALETALAGWGTRISTGRLNTFLKELQDAHPHPVRGGKQPRILFGTQPGVRPPTFVLFTTGFLEAPYRRFIERRLREDFEFLGTPIAITLKIRKKRRGHNPRR